MPMYLSTFAVAALCCVGLYRHRRSVVMVLVLAQLLPLAAILALVQGSAIHGNSGGQIFVVLIIALVTTQIAVGLCVAITYLRTKKTLSLEGEKLMKG